MAEDRGDGTLECPVNDGLISSGPDPLLLPVSQLGSGAGLFLTQTALLLMLYVLLFIHSVLHPTRWDV